MNQYAAAFASPNGPGDNRPTAEQVLNDTGLRGKLAGKTILITGGTSGLGKETARVLRQTGAKVYISARSVAKGQAVAQAIANAVKNAAYQDIGVVEMELSSLDSVRRGTAAFLAECPKLNVLMTNAGLMGSTEQRTVDGFELQFAVNHLAHFLLFHLVKPALLAAAASTPDFKSRVVSVSSAGHRISTLDPDNYNLEGGAYDPFVAYGRTKTANIWMANELDRRFAAQGVHGLSLHPGTIFETKISRHLESDGNSLFDHLTGEDPMFAKVAMNTEQGAATQVWAAISNDLEGKGGVYLDALNEAIEAPPDATISSPGYWPYIYDKALEGRLWRDSLKMVGLPQEE